MSACIIIIKEIMIIIINSLVRPDMNVSVHTPRETH